jgi:hypothetical protein
VSLLGAVRAALARTGGGVRVDKAAQEEALRLCLASAAASRRGHGGGTEDPNRLLRELGFVSSNLDQSKLEKLLGF